MLNKYTMRNMQLQAPITSTILYPLLISVFITAIHARNYHQICTSSCGDIQNISYPFRLKTDPPSCGDTDYELSCQNNQTILEFNSGNYLVRKISYDEHIISLVDINFSNGSSTSSSSTSCNIPSVRIASLQETIASDYRYTRPGPHLLHSYISFLNCSTNITHPAYTRVPCFGTENSSSSSYYIYAVYEGYLLPDPLQQYNSCFLISMAPADYVDIKFPPYEVILELLKSGFDLGWSVKCRDCLLSGYSCTLSSWDNPLVYECGERAYWDSEVYLYIIPEFIGIALCWRYICASIVIYVFLIHKLCTTRKTMDDNIENNMKVEESTPSSSMVNNADVEMSERKKVVNVNDVEILEVYGDSSLSSPPPLTSMEIDLQSDSSTEWLISESMEKDSTKVIRYEC